MLHLIAFLVIGGVIGFLAGIIVRGRGFGIIGDVIVGVIGSVVGGWVWEQLFPNRSLGYYGSLVVGLISAVILVAILKAIAGRRGAVTSP
jgi:uncharacterized membrane protein YeaQ/YmgE (transglycosylase-associated protein family)